MTGATAVQPHNLVAAMRYFEGVKERLGWLYDERYCDVCGRNLGSI